MNLELWVDGVIINFCLHEKTKYVGLTESYDYCSKCGVKL